MQYCYMETYRKWFTKLIGSKGQSKHNQVLPTYNFWLCCIRSYKTFYKRLIVTSFLHCDRINCLKILFYLSSPWKNCCVFQASLYVCPLQYIWSKLIVQLWRSGQLCTDTYYHLLWFWLCNFRTQTLTTMLQRITSNFC